MNKIDEVRELLAAECTDRAASLEKSAASDRETGDSIQEAIDSGVELTPDEPQDAAAWLLYDAERAEATAGLLRRAAAALLAAPPGYVLVPVEPTEDMVDASMISVDLSKYGRRATLRVLGARAWAAMLAAAPQPK